MSQKIFFRTNCAFCGHIEEREVPIPSKDDVFTNCSECNRFLITFYSEVEKDSE